MAMLILLKSPGGTHSGEQIQLSTEKSSKFVLGRDHGQVQIYIDDGKSSVSRQHAEIICNNGQFFLTDLDSRNFTYLNQKRLVPRQQVPLRHNDRIKICEFMFRFSDPSNPDSSGSNVSLSDSSDAEPGSEHDGTKSTIEATVARVPTGQLLELQPTDRLKALIEISTTMGTSLEMEQVLPRISETLFDLFRQADRCFVIEWDPESDLFRPRAVHTRRPGQVSESFSRTIVRKCIETQQAYLSEDATGDSSLASSQSVAEFRIRSVMCVPVITPKGKAWGVIQLDCQDFTKKFTKDDVRMMMAVANMAAVSLENARLHAEMIEAEKEKQEIALARQVQEGLLPKCCPDLPPYEFFAFYTAAHSVGGDYYDFIKYDDGRLVVLVGDVAGKGVPAAILVAKLSAEAKFAFRSDRADLATSVQCLNDELCAADLAGRFVTMVAVMINPNSGKVIMVNAGHETPLIYRADTGTLESANTNDQAGPLLAVVPGYPYEQVELDLNVGDTLIMFTDGIPDAENRQLVRFKREGLENALVQESVTDTEILEPKSVGARIRDAVTRHGTGHPQSDDIALVCLGRTESPTSETQKLSQEKLRFDEAQYDMG